MSISKHSNNCTNKVTKTNPARGAYSQSLPDLYPYRPTGKRLFYQSVKMKETRLKNRKVNSIENIGKSQLVSDKVKCQIIVMVFRNHNYDFQKT